jgi:hypothetical protein
MSLFSPPNKLRTPVLFVIFNRADTTRKVFEAIREAKPPRLYVAADGPRQHLADDALKCKEAREIINEVDWECEVKTLFREENLGCGVGVSSAITWFFENEESGIILEDDCLPSQTFFWFCEQLLERFKDDDRVMHIGGNNFLNGWRNDKDYSYYFSHCGHIWGWATWRRAWTKFDYKIKLYETLKQKGYFDNFFLNPIEKLYRLRKFDKTVSGKATWWGYQWDFARYVYNGLSIVPEQNIVKNIGFGEDATHTKNNQRHQREAYDIEFPLRHPPFTMRDVDSDRKYFASFMKGNILAKLSLSI